MADPTRLSPVAGRAWHAPGGVALLDAQPASIVHVHGAQEQAMADLPRGWAALWTGPRQWLVAADEQGPEGVVEALRRRVPAAVAIDVSDGRRRLRLEGAGAVELLHTGIALELTPDACPPGRAVPTAYREIPVLVHAVAAARFDLYVPRSFARCLWDWLEDAAAGVGAPDGPQSPWEGPIEG